MPEIPEEAVQATAEVLYRDYDSEYGADHLSWRDFTDQARKLLEAAAPILAEQIRRDLLAAARSCSTCGEIHQRRPVESDDGISYMSWAHPKDGHAYFQASQDGAAWLACQIGEARDSR